MANKELGIADPVYDALRIRSGQSIAPDLGGGSFGAGGLENKIYVWHADGSTLDIFDPDAAGLALALAAAASGDRVWCPQVTIALTTGITIPAGIILSRALLSFSGFSGTAITLSAGSVLDGVSVNYTATGYANAVGIEVVGIDGWIMTGVSVYVHGASSSNTGTKISGATASTRSFVAGSSFHGNGGANARGIHILSGGNVTITQSYGLARAATSTNYGIYNEASGGATEPYLEHVRGNGELAAGTMYGLYNGGYCQLWHCTFNGTTGGIKDTASSVTKCFSVEWSSFTNLGSIVYLPGDRLASSGAAVSSIAEYASTNVSNPPTAPEIDSAFGLANVVGSGFLGLINDNAAELSIYLAASTGYNWYYMNLTRAALSSALLLTLLASDSYTGANGTHLNVHTMDTGGGWTENAGSWTINGNAAVQGTSTGTGVIYIATTDSGQANIHLTVKVKTSYASGAGSAGIIARFSDTSNYWLIYCNWDAGEVTIREINAGVSTARATKSWSKQYQKSVQIDVNLSGNTIAATFDGGYGLTYTSAFNNTATKHGIAEVRETGTPYQANSFDDFQAISLAANPWTRQGTVVAAGGEPTVLYDSNPLILTGDKVFKMWHVGSTTNAIDYAESADGVTWTAYGSNPVWSGGMRARVIKYGGIYYLYASNNDTRIDLYTSTNGVAWTLDTTGVLNLGTAGAWDDQHIANTFIWQDAPNDWRLLYEANSGGGPWHIGYATSTDGRTWSKSGSNPVLSEEGSTGRPFVKKVGAYYYLWCHRSSAGKLPLYLVRYRSQNLTAWTRWPESVIIPRVGAGEGEDTYLGQASDMTIMEYNGQAYLYFVGIDDGTGGGSPSHIALATANLAAIYDY